MKNKNLPISHFTPLTSQSGQAIVFIIGALATAFIFGVLASYLATTSIKKTAYTGQAEAALHAAEAGCRHVLAMDDATLQTYRGQCDAEGDCANAACRLTLGAPTDKDQSSVCTWVTTLAGNSPTYVVPNQVNQDETVQIDLTGASGNLNVYWCNSGDENCNTVYPALEAAVIYQESGTYRLNRYAYDGNAASRGNNFTAPGPAATVSGINFAFGTQGSSSQISLPANTTFIRLKPLYNADNPITIAVEATSNIPSQGFDIRCRGTMGQSTRTVQVTKENPAVSSIFDYVLFSGTEITK